jgi:hypothetical protein
MEDFRFVAERGAVGVFFDMYFEHWANLAPYYYLVTQLAWNPFANGNAILDDYFQRCYGPASDPMKQYWMLLENTRQKFVDAVESRFRVMEIHNHCTNEVLEEAAGFLEEAARLAAAHQGDVKFADRVNFTRSGFEYLSSIVEIRSMMQRFEGRNQKDKEFEEQILAKWEALVALIADFPPHAVNMKRMSPSTGSSENSRLVGLHPATPVTRKMLRSISTSGLDLD